MERQQQQQQEDPDGTKTMGLHPSRNLVKEEGKVNVEGGDGEITVAQSTVPGVFHTQNGMVSQETEGVMAHEGDPGVVVGGSVSPQLTNSQTIVDCGDGQQEQNAITANVRGLKHTQKDIEAKRKATGVMARGGGHGIVGAIRAAGLNSRGLQHTQNDINAKRVATGVMTRGGQGIVGTVQVPPPTIAASEEQQKQPEMRNSNGLQHTQKDIEAKRKATGVAVRRGVNQGLGLPAPGPSSANSTILGGQRQPHGTNMGGLRKGRNDIEAKRRATGFPERASGNVANRITTFRGLRNNKLKKIRQTGEVRATENTDGEEGKEEEMHDEPSVAAAPVIDHQTMESITNQEAGQHQLFAYGGASQSVSGLVVAAEVPEENNIGSSLPTATSIDIEAVQQRKKEEQKKNIIYCSAAVGVGAVLLAIVIIVVVLITTNQQRCVFCNCLLALLLSF